MGGKDHHVATLQTFRNVRKSISGADVTDLVLSVPIPLPLRPMKRTSEIGKNSRAQVQNLIFNKLGSVLVLVSRFGVCAPVGNGKESIFFRSHVSSLPRIPLATELRQNLPIECWEKPPPGRCPGCQKFREIPFWARSIRNSVRFCSGQTRRWRHENGN